MRFVVRFLVLCAIGAPLAGCSSVSSDDEFIFPVVRQTRDTEGDSIQTPPSYPLGLWAFGGMYSESGDGGYANPATGEKNCPLGYDSVQTLGSEGEDAELFYCKKDSLESLELPVFDFGGMYGRHSNGNYINPLTGFASCPSGFNSYQVYGDESLDQDLFFCGKVPDSENPSAIGFGGLFGEDRDETLNYVNPETNELACPVEFESVRVLGSSDQDWPLSVCMSALSDEVSFSSLGGLPVVIEFSPEYDRGLLGFGGMYSRKRSNPALGHVNPATGDYSCPEGYSENLIVGRASIYGVVYEDWDVISCYRDNLGRFELAKYDFGGAYGRGNSGDYNNNIATNDQSCPSGFSTVEILGDPTIDWPMWYCYREQKKSEPTPYSLGGFWSDSNYGTQEGQYPNIITDASSCPSGYDQTKIHGAEYGFRDARLHMCTSEIVSN